MAIFIRNDYGKSLRNEFLGTVVRVAASGIVTAAFDGVEHALAGPALADLTHAYAITVHKAQGSSATARSSSLPSRGRWSASW